MLLRRGWLLLSALLLAVAASAQVEPAGTPQAVDGVGSAAADLEIDFLLSYYDQDGENSPVTGGVGTEDLQVVSPVFLLRWRLNDDWNLSANVGVDNITSASTDNIDDNVSSASRLDNRVFTTLEASRKLGNQTLRVSTGFSKEYDYSSLMLGLGWSRDFNQRNTTLAAALRLYGDEYELYDIDGIVQGTDDRDTLDFSLSLTQILGPKTVGSVELSWSDQEGFLSTPFHEVVLDDGSRVAERLPRSRTRNALGLRLHHAFTERFVLRTHYRFYDDDFEIQGHTLEVEPHFRLGERSAWLYPILRYHTQDGSPYFGLPGTFSAGDEFFTADRDLSEFDSEKFGLGWRVAFDRPRQGFLGHIRRVDARVTSYSRDDGLDAMTASFGIGWRF